MYEWIEWDHDKRESNLEPLVEDSRESPENVEKDSSANHNQTLQERCDSLFRPLTPPEFLTCTKCENEDAPVMFRCVVCDVSCGRRTGLIKIEKF